MVRVHSDFLDAWAPIFPAFVDQAGTGTPVTMQTLPSSTCLDEHHWWATALGIQTRPMCRLFWKRSLTI